MTQGPAGRIPLDDHPPSEDNPRVNSQASLDALAVERIVIDALILAPDGELVETPRWVQLRTPSLPGKSGNGVYLARLEPEHADARISKVLDEHAGRNAACRWFVGPSSSPPDLPERLERAGLTRLGESVGMSMRVPCEHPPLPANTEMRAVGPADIETFVALSMRTWQAGPAFADSLTRALKRGMARSDDAQRSWIASVDGEAVGTTTLRLLRGSPRIGYLQGAAVLPAQRGKGVYLAMLHHRLALLHELGFEHAIIWAGEHSSAGQARRVGFEPRCRGVFFEWSPT